MPQLQYTCIPQSRIGPFGPYGPDWPTICFVVFIVGAFFGIAVPA